MVLDMPTGHVLCFTSSANSHYIVEGGFYWCLVVGEGVRDVTLKEKRGPLWGAGGVIIKEEGEGKEG